MASVEGIVTLVLAIVGMVAVAIVAWRVVQKQERDDPEFEAKLRADDERAAAGRAGETERK
jgi:hypothetical protein